MDFLENPAPPSPTHSIQARRPLPFRRKPFAFWGSAVLILFLALSLSYSRPGVYKLQHLRSLLPTNHPLKSSPIARFMGFLLQTNYERLPKPPPAATSRPCVLWMAPFLSGGGYSSEAWSYVTALDADTKNPVIRLKIEHHGDQASLEFWDGLPEKTRDLAYRLSNTECRMNETVVICHSEPGAWYPPLFQTFPCPPTGYKDPMVVVGRTMFETDRLNPEHVRRCDQMDYVWVPTEFHVSTFIHSGVDPTKVVKMVQSVDIEFFDPSKYKPMILPSERPIFSSNDRSPDQVSRPDEFVFLSIFKWEYRKGWDVLLKSYLQEFSKSDGVALYLLTNPYHSDKDFKSKIRKFIEDSDVEEPVDGWAPIHVIDAHVPQIDLPRIYKAADAFVLPSRGEGWGRPLVEAMAMSLPVIATNWSGPTEYLTEENGYPLPVDQMSRVTEGPFMGHLWAEPSGDQLRILMRRVMSNPQEAWRRGKHARETMVRRFSPEVVAGLVIDRIMKISGQKTESNPSVEHG